MATFSNEDYSGPFSSKYEEDQALAGNRGNQARHMATQARHSQGLTGSGRIDTSAFGRNRDVFGNDQYEKATDNPINSLIRFANRPEMLEEQAPANPTQSGLGSFLNRFGQDVQMGLSNILSGGAFQNDPNEQINRLVERGYSLSDAADFVNSTQRTMEQNKIQRTLYGDTSDPSSSVLSGDEGTGDEGTGDEGTGDEGTGDGGTGDEGTGVPTSTNFRFFGGYNPVSRSDVLVPSTFQRDITTPDPRLDPMFPQRPEPVEYRQEDEVSGGFDYGDGGFTPVQFSTMQELMDYQQQFPSLNLMGEYKRLRNDPNYRGDGTNFGMIENNSYRPSVEDFYRQNGNNAGLSMVDANGNPLINRDMFAQGGVDRLFGNEQAPPYMYQGIMS